MTWLQYFSSIREQASDKDLFDQYVELWGQADARLHENSDPDRKWYYINTKKECELNMMRLTRSGYFSGTEI